MASTSPYHFYCDESGSTGGNYQDSEQPIMVLAGWLVPSGGEERLTQSVDQLVAGSRAPEIHAKRLLRKPARWGRIRELVEVGLQNGAIPFFYIVEKRHQLAERVVHALLDAETNSCARRIPRIGSPAYNELVARLGSILSGEALAAFARAVAHPSKPVLRAAIEEIACSLRERGENDLAHSVEGSLESIDEVMATDFSDRNGLTHQQLTSPHLPGLLRLLEAVDARASRVGVERVDVVHDETLQFVDAFRKYVRVMGRVGHLGPIRPVLSALPTIGFETIKDLRTTSSESCRCVQLADVLATALARLVRDVDVGEEWTADGRSIASVIFEPLLRDDLRSGGISATPQLCQKLRLRLMPRARH